jgi:hypothetical protein
MRLPRRRRPISWRLFPRLHSDQHIELLSLAHAKTRAQGLDDDLGTG